MLLLITIALKSLKLNVNYNCKHFQTFPSYLIETLQQALKRTLQCPHDVPCPRFIRSDKTPCNFIQNYQNLNSKVVL